MADQAEANAGGQPALTREQREQLIRLRWLWPGYKIDCDGRTWSASPSIALDEVITADTHQALWGKIKTDNGLDLEAHATGSSACQPAVLWTCPTAPAAGPAVRLVSSARCWPLLC